MKYNDVLTEELYNQHQVWLQDHNIGTQLVLSNAVLTGANLCDANLSNAVLTGVNLIYANLIYANLSDANLSSANLCDANLSSVDLRYANLTRANLSGVNLYHTDLYHTDLSGANITFCTPDNIRIKRIDLPRYKVNILDNHTITIGCQQHHLDQWKSFSDEQIDKMDYNALQWWNTHKTTIFNFIEEQQ
jgi:hypothetical protein